MSEAIKAYNSVTATEEFKNLEWIRRKTIHDEAQALYNARRIEKQLADEEWQNVIAIKDAELANKDTALANKDAALANKDALIAELLARLEALE